MRVSMGFRGETCDSETVVMDEESKNKSEEGALALDEEYPCGITSMLIHYDSDEVSGRSQQLAHTFEEGCMCSKNQQVALILGRN